MSISSISGFGWASLITPKAKAGQNLPGNSVVPGNSGTTDATGNAANAGSAASPGAASAGFPNSSSGSGSSGSSSSGGSSASTGGNSAVQQFQQYMNETPAQRMLASWLASQGLTLQQFDAMSPTEQQKLLRQMQEDLETKMKQDAATQSNTLAKTNILV